MLLTGSFNLEQLARKKGSEKPKGFYKQGGKSKPISEKKGVRESDMKIDVKGNNDRIKVDGDFTRKHDKKFVTTQFKLNKSIATSNNSPDKKYRFIVGEGYQYDKDARVQMDIPDRPISEFDTGTIIGLHQGEPYYYDVLNDRTGQMEMYHVSHLLPNKIPNDEDAIKILQKIRNAEFRDKTNNIDWEQVETARKEAVRLMKK